MIANHDWSMRAGPQGDECCHNARLMGVAAPGQVIPVPYDFDFSGLVNAPYATAPDVLDIASVRQRLYRGYCIHSAQAMAAAAEMRAKKAEIIGVLSQIPGLDPRTRDSSANYLNGFFNLIATDESTAKAIRGCI